MEPYFFVSGSAKKKGETEKARKHIGIKKQCKEKADEIAW
jgi:hypothetical protein